MPRNERAERYNKSHPEKVREAQKRYRDAHREELREKNRAYQSSQEIRERINNRGRKRNRKKEHVQKIAELHVPLKDKCEMCGRRAEQRHHPDYSKPLDVVHLCAVCHVNLHLREKANVSSL